MNDMSSDAFRENVRRISRLRIEGTDVNPKEVMIGGNPDAGGHAVRLDIELSSVALHHELSEAGVSVEPADLEEFVRNDLKEHPQEALTGYLRIAQGILNPGKPKRFLGLFGKKEPHLAAKWSIIRIEKVATLGDRIVLSGVAHFIQQETA